MIPPFEHSISLHQLLLLHKDTKPPIQKPLDHHFAIMKFSVVALFAAGALAMPAGNACSSSSSEYPPPSYPTPTTTSSYPYPTPNNGGGEYPPPPPPPPPAYTTSPPAYTTSPPNGGGWGNGGNGGNGGNNGGGNGGNGGGNGGNGGNNGGGHQFKCPSGLYSNPQCCALGILGLADLDCESRK